VHTPTPPAKKGLSANWAVGEMDHLFGRIGRYTRFVLFGKWFLLAVAVALVTTLIALPLISKDRSGLRVSFVDSGAKPTGPTAQPVMNHPEYRSTDAKGQQFKVNGLRAVQVTPELVTIEQVEAQLAMENGGWRTLTAASADYTQANKIVELKGVVTMRDNQGYRFVTERAIVNTDTMNVDGPVAVSGEGPLGNLLASGFEIRDSGQHIRFLGGEQPVRLHIDRTKK